MRIQWFPGHMTKALRMMEDNIKLCDTVIYIIDSRAVHSSINESFNKIIANKPILYVLNKVDLADEDVTKNWLDYFKKQGKTVICADGTNSRSTSKIVDNLKKINQETILRYSQKGANKTIRAMVIGIPNCGKSTIINSLCKEKRANTGDKAGVTKGKQWIKVSEYVEVLDTPGTLCPAFENAIVGQHLAYIGSINDMIVDFEGLCLDFLQEICEIKKQALSQRYNIKNFEMSALEMYEHICKTRGFILKANEYDYARGAKAIIDDFRKGRLGNISLEDTKDYV